MFAAAAQRPKQGCPGGVQVPLENRMASMTEFVMAGLVPGIHVVAA
jgi:hypothetical protein